MTHYNIDYSKSPAPQFDAVQDTIEYLGAAKFQELSQLLMPCKSPSTWRMALSFAGVQGFPAKAWYEHINGQGSWVEPKWED